MAEHQPSNIAVSRANETTVCSIATGRSVIELEPKYLLQMAHLTTPATVWKYVESAVTKSKANLVMLDLEDSIPRDNAALLEEGRANVIRAFNELDWGTRLRFFRPRGLELDLRTQILQYRRGRRKQSRRA